MAGRKTPVFGVISLLLMLGLIAAGIAISIYGSPIRPSGQDESLAVVIESAASTIATLLVIAAVSFSSLILAGVSLLRGEVRWPGSVGICLSLAAIVVVVLAVANL